MPSISKIVLIWGTQLVVLVLVVLYIIFLIFLNPSTTHQQTKHKHTLGNSYSDTFESAAKNSERATPVKSRHFSGDTNSVENTKILETFTREHTLTEQEAINAVREVESIVFNRANSMFLREPVDQQWAPELERKVRAMFLENNALSRCSIQRIECRFTQCQIIAYTPHSRDADFFLVSIICCLGTQ